MRQKKISREEYIKIFCPEKRIRDRKVLYVSGNIYRKIRNIVSLFKEEYVTATSLVDAILHHHIEQYKNLLLELHANNTLDIDSLKKLRVLQEGYEDEQDYASEENGQNEASEEANESEPLGSF